MSTLTINNQDLVTIEAFEDSGYEFDFTYPEYIHSDLYMVVNTETKHVTLSTTAIGDVISWHDFVVSYLIN